MIENFENMDIKGFTEVFFHQIEKSISIRG